MTNRIFSYPLRGFAFLLFFIYSTLQVSAQQATGSIVSGAFQVCPGSLAETKIILSGAAPFTITLTRTQGPSSTTIPLTVNANQLVGGVYTYSFTPAANTSNSIRLTSLSNAEGTGTVSGTARAYYNVVTPVASISYVSPSVCSGENMINISGGATTCNGVPFLWEYSMDNGVNWQEIPGSSNQTAPNTSNLLYNNGTTDLTVFIRIKTTGANNTPVYSPVKTFLLKPVFTGGTASIDQAYICGGKPFTLSYSGNTTDVIWELSSDGVNFTYNLGSGKTLTTTNDPGALSTLYIRAKLGSTTCWSVSYSNIISVPAFPQLYNPEIRFTGSAMEGVSTKTICNNGTVSLYGYRGLAGTRQWMSSSDGITYTPIAGANTSTYNVPPSNNTGLQPIITYYRLDNISGTCDRKSSNTLTVTVLPSPNAGTVTTNVNSVCPNETVDLSVSSYTGASTGIIWQYSYNNTTFQDIDNAPSASSFSSIPAPIANFQTDIYYRTKIGTYNSCGGEVFSPAVKVTIYPEIKAPVMQATSLNKIICTGTSTTLNINWGGGLVQWMISTDGGTSFTPVNGANQYSFNTGILTNTGASSFVYYYKVVVTSGSCMQFESAPAAVTVKPIPSVGVASVNDNDFCPGETLSLSLTSYSDKVKWQESQNGTYFYEVVNGASAQYVPANIIGTSTRYYRAVAGDFNSCGPVVYSNTVSVTVHPLITAPSIDPDYKNLSICTGSSTDIYLRKTDGGTVQWMVSTDGINYTPAPNSTNSNRYTTTTLTNAGPGIVHYYIKAVSSSGTCMSFDSDVADVQVHPLNRVGTVSVDKTTICDGEGVNLQLSGYNGSSINWQVLGGSSYGDVTGATALTYSPVNITKQNWGAQVYFRVRVSGTVCQTDVYSTPVMITVVTAPSATKLGVGQSANVALCSGNSATLTLATSNQQALNGQLQWYDSYAGNATAIPGANALTLTTGSLTNTSTAAETHTYYAIVSSGSCLPVRSPDIVVQVKPQPVAGTISSVNNPVCNNSGTTLSLTNYVGSTFLWEKAPGASSFSIVSGATTPTLATGNLTLQTRYRATVNTSGIGCTAAVTPVITITITTAAAVPTTPAGPANVCTQTTTSDYTVAAATNAVTYQWQISPAAAGTISGTGTTGTVSWNTGYLGTASITVASANSCGTSAYSNAYTTTINALPTVTITDLATNYCPTDAAPLITGTPGGGTFSGPGIEYAPFFGKARFGPGVAGEGTHVISYAYTDATTGCSNTATATTTVNSYPNLKNASTVDATCEGDVQQYSFELEGAISTVEWYRSDPITGWALVTNNSTYTVVTTATETTLSIVTDYSLNGRQYLCRLTGPCSNGIYSGIFTLNLNTNTRISVEPTDVEACELAINAGTSVTATGTAPFNYQWQVNNGSGFTDISGATSSTLTLGNVTPGMNNNQYRCIVNGACGPQATSTAANLIVHNAPVVSAGSDVAVCSGNSTTLSASGAATYTWDNGISDNVSFIPAQTTTYTVTGTDANGCQNTDQVVVTVNPLPTVSMTVLNSTYCQSGIPAQLVPLAGTPSGGVFTGPGVSGSNYTPTNVGNNTITYTYTNANGCTKSTSRSTTVLAKPFAPFACANAQGWCTAGQVEICIFNSDFSAPTWKLYDNNMTLLPGYGLTTPSVSANTTFFLSSSNAQGCESNRTAIPVYIGAQTVQNINACGQPTVNLYNALTGFDASTVTFHTLPNKPEVANAMNYPVAGDATVYAIFHYYKSNGTVSCNAPTPVNIYASACRTAAAPVTTNKMIVFPNPADDYLTIQLDKSCEEVTLTLHNLQGIEVYQKTLISIDGKIKLEGLNLPAGLYTLTVKCDAEVFHTNVSIVR